jgi:hypothetical protein
MYLTLYTVSGCNKIVAPSSVCQTEAINNGEIRMTVSKLTKEQIEILSNYPQVARITDATVVFTQTFKRHFCEEYIKGHTPRTILKESGIDPDVLGVNL